MLLRNGTFSENLHNDRVFPPYTRQERLPLPGTMLSSVRVPSLQSVFNTVRKALEEARKDRANNTSHVPLYAYLATRWDLSLMLFSLIHIDTGVRRFMVVLNEGSTVSQIVLGAFQVAFGNRFLAIYNTVNIGVSASWNKILDVAFEGDLALPYVVISNAGIFRFL